MVILVASGGFSFSFIHGDYSHPCRVVVLVWMGVNEWLTPFHVRTCADESARECYQGGVWVPAG